MVLFKPVKVLLFLKNLQLLLLNLLWLGLELLKRLLGLHLGLPGFLE